VHENHVLIVAGLLDILKISVNVTISQFWGS